MNSHNETRRRPILCGLGAGLFVAATVFGAEVSPAHASGTVRWIDLRASLLHAGSTTAEVARVLGEPTRTTGLGQPESGDVALSYANEAIGTQIVLRGGKVTSIALDIIAVDAAALPPRARVIKPTMVDDGVTQLLGETGERTQWTDSGLTIEQLTFARAGETAFSVFLADGLVVDVRVGRERPPGVGLLLLPSTSSGDRLAIGLSPAQVESVLGPTETATSFALKGQPVEYATYREGNGEGHVTVTFIGGVSTAFEIWPAEAWPEAGG
jgi:hypothetical protein